MRLVHSFNPLLSNNMTREQRQKNQQRKQNVSYRDSQDWDDILSPEEYLDRLDQRLYERSQYAR